MRTYEEQIKYWAQERFGTSVEEIGSVELELGTEWCGYCKTCLHSYPVIEVWVWGKNHKRLYTGQVGTDPGSLIRDIMEA